MIFMKNQLKYFLFGFILILFSTPLGRLTLNIIYYNKNLGDYEILLNGFMNSYVLIGIMLYVLGLVKMLICEKYKRWFLYSLGMYIVVPKEFFINPLCYLVKNFFIHSLKPPYLIYTKTLHFLYKVYHITLWLYLIDCP